MLPKIKFPIRLHQVSRVISVFIHLLVSVCVLARSMYERFELWTFLSSAWKGHVIWLICRTSFTWALAIITPADHVVNGINLVYALENHIRFSRHVKIHLRRLYQTAATSSKSLASLLYDLAPARKWSLQSHQISFELNVGITCTGRYLGENLLHIWAHRLTPNLLEQSSRSYLSPLSISEWTKFPKQVYFVGAIYSRSPGLS